MRRQIASAVVVAGFMLLAAWGMPHLQALGLFPGGRAELSQRAINVVSGLMVVWLANAAPKRFKRLDETGCDPAREQRSRRVSGLAIVIGGLLYTLAWLAAPIDLALPLSIACLSGALFVTLAQCLLFRGRAAPSGR